MPSPPLAQAVVVLSKMNQPHRECAAVSLILTTFGESDERHGHLRMTGRREGRLGRWAQGDTHGSRDTRT